MGLGPARGVAGHPRGRLGAACLGSSRTPRGRGAKGLFRRQLKSGVRSDIALWTEVRCFLNSKHGKLGCEPVAGAWVVQ